MPEPHRVKHLKGAITKQADDDYYREAEGPAFDLDDFVSAIGEAHETAQHEDIPQSTPN